MADQLARYLPPEGEKALGDATLFTRSDEVEAAWRLYTPLLELIEDAPEQLPVHPYEARTWGPGAADNLLAEDGLMWRRP